MVVVSIAVVAVVVCNYLQLVCKFGLDAPRR